MCLGPGRQADSHRGCSGREEGSVARKLRGRRWGSTSPAASVHVGRAELGPGMAAASWGQSCAASGCRSSVRPSSVLAEAGGPGCRARTVVAGTLSCSGPVLHTSVETKLDPGAGPLHSPLTPPARRTQHLRVCVHGVALRDGVSPIEHPPALKRTHGA